MACLIIYLPLINAIIAGCCGNLLGIFGIRSSTAFCLTGVQLLCFWLFQKTNITYINAGEWMSFNSFSIDWSFIFDHPTIVMLFVVNFVSTLVHLYSFYYMSSDPSLPRFISYLSLFTFFMNILVSSGNLLVLFIGWEGVGLCSYLLIGFWYTRLQANKSAIKALVVNRFGDYFFLIGAFLILSLFHTTEWLVFLSTFGSSSSFILSSSSVSLISLFLFLGAMAKSAQIGLHTWLPDAMEGPTPVSALIHAATMVTAGVFLLFRCSSLFCFTSPAILCFITFVGAVTAFFAASAGLVQNDLKKVIAYSTCSQLGYMVFSAGLLNFTSSFFHLFNHAFFKALLFLGAGSVIHSLGGEQDMRRMGGLARQLPLVGVVMLIASLSLAGFPFLSGFFSKDHILESAFALFNPIALFSYWLGFFVAVLTAFYSFRLLILVFLGKPRMFRIQTQSIHSTSYLEVIVLGSLCVLSIFSGFVCQVFFTGLGSTFLAMDLLHISTSPDFEFLPTCFKILPTVGSLFGLISSFILHKTVRVFTNYRRIYYQTFVFLSSKWSFDFVYNFYLSHTFFNLSIASGDLVEKTLDRLYVYIPSFAKGGLVLHKKVPSDFFFYVWVVALVFFCFFCMLLLTDGFFCFNI